MLDYRLLKACVLIPNNSIATEKRRNYSEFLIETSEACSYDITDGNLECNVRGVQGVIPGGTCQSALTFLCHALLVISNV